MNDVTAWQKDNLFRQDKPHKLAIKHKQKKKTTSGSKACFT